MAMGPGKYDGLATKVRKQSNAEGVVVIVLGGNKGSGFSVQGNIKVILNLPTLLRTLADDIEQDR